MFVNIISWIGIVMTVFYIKFLDSKKENLKYLKIICWILLVYKIGQYTYLSFTQGFTYPVEISTVTYFVFTIVVVIGKEKLYSIASFFGMLSGFGYFTYYSILGYQATFHLGLYDLIIAIFSHGVLFAGGVYLSKIYYFPKKNRFYNYIVLALMLLNAAYYYRNIDSSRNFIFLVVKPTYLNLFEYNLFNIGIKILFYVAWTGFILVCTKLFYLFNRHYHPSKTPTSLLKSS